MSSDTTQIEISLTDSSSEKDYRELSDWLRSPKRGARVKVSTNYKPPSPDGMSSGPIESLGVHFAFEKVNEFLAIIKRWVQDHLVSQKKNTKLRIKIGDNEFELETDDDFETVAKVLNGEQAK